MNEIEQKALALVNEVTGESVSRITHASHYDLQLTLYRAIEQHEAYKQKVSNRARKVVSGFSTGHWVRCDLEEFITPAPKPDPLVAVLGDLEWNNNSPECAAELRAALEACGLEIRSKNDD